jgi:archaellum component FlaC/uncharacterized coiled-coil protein SlyX
LVTIIGSGFGNQEDNIGFTFGAAATALTVVPGYGTAGTTAGTVKADSSGAFAATFVVPTIAGGNYLMHISAVPTIPDVTFTITAKLTVSPTSGNVGTTVTLSGTGFTDGNIAANTITLGGKTVTHALATVASGVLPPTTFPVPAVSGGGQKLTIVVQAKSFVDVFTVNPQITAINDLNIATNTINAATMQGNPGDPLKIVGTGFLAGEAVTVSFGTTSAPTTYGGIPSATGALDIRVTIPETLSGLSDATYTVSAAGSTSGNKGSMGGFVVKALGATPKIFLNLNPTGIMGSVAGQPVSGYVGDAINVMGTGFVAGELVTAVTWDGATAATTPTPPFIATVRGKFTADFIVPASTRGTHVVDITATSNPAGVNFDVASKIVLNPSAAPVNNTVTVSGTGYANGETGIALNWDQLITLTTATASGTGSFTETFTVPGSAPGLHILEADSLAGVGAPFDFTAPFTVLEEITLNDVLEQIDDLNDAIADLNDFVDTEISSVTTSLTTLSNTVNQLSSTVSSVSSTVSQLSSTVNSLSSTVTSVSGNVDSLSGTVDSLSDTIGTLETTAGTLQSALTSLSGTVAGMQTTLNNAATKTDVAAVSSTVTSLSNTVTSLQTSATNLEATLSTLGTTVAGMQTTLNNAASKTDVAAVESDLSALSSTVTSLSSTADSMQSALSALSTTVAGMQTTLDNAATKTDVDAVSADLATVKTSIDSLDTEVGDTGSALANINTMVIVAVVLAAVAAGAAVLTIVLVYRKIAA